VVASDREILRSFLNENKRIVIKPLDSMGGDGVFLVNEDDVNFDVIWEVHTQRGTYPVVAQKFMPEIRDGDKRVVVIDGKPYGHALVRLPKAGSIRGNLAAGGTYEVFPLTPAEAEIADTVGAALKDRGIVFAGLDIIGDRLTEVNITSPTGLRQISAATGEDVGLLLMRAITGL
jgi:glutathione synthase